MLSVLLEQHGHGALAEKIIYLAGHKVTTDPFAIPFSMVSFVSTCFVYCLQCLYTCAVLRGIVETFPRIHTLLFFSV